MSPSENPWPKWLPLREELRELHPYGAPQIRNVIALNTNENPYPLPTPVKEAILERLNVSLDEINRYPDRDAINLRLALAKYIANEAERKHSVDLAIDHNNLWAANGSNEILQTIFLAFGGAGRKALGFTPSYSVHPLIARSTGTAWINGNRDEDFELDLSSSVRMIEESQPALVFLTTPNNPTGGAIELEVIGKLSGAAAAVGALLIVDEAYSEFSAIPSATHLIATNPHLLVVRTMSKAFAFAGARVGYLVADPSVVEALQLVRLPYHLSATTQVLAEVALDHAPLLQKEVEMLITGREELADGLRALGLTSLPSSANFLLFTGFPGSSAELWQKLVDAKVLIRDVGIEGYLRVTVGTPDENRKFLTELSRVLA